MRIIQMSDLIALKIERILQVTSEAQNTPMHFSSFRTILISLQQNIKSMFILILLILYC